MLGGVCRSRRGFCGGCGSVAAPLAHRVEDEFSSVAATHNDGEDDAGDEGRAPDARGDTGHGRLRRRP